MKIVLKWRWSYFALALIIVAILYGTSVYEAKPEPEPLRIPTGLAGGKMAADYIRSVED